MMEEESSGKVRFFFLCCVCIFAKVYSILLWPSLKILSACYLGEDPEKILRTEHANLHQGRDNLEAWPYSQSGTHHHYFLAPVRIGSKSKVISVSSFLIMFIVTSLAKIQGGANQTGPRSNSQSTALNCV
jgi:hypothetical protein